MPLGDDLMDRILTFSPTFASLQSTILVSKAFYNVYHMQPKSMTWAAAYNIADRTLWTADNEDPDTMATNCPEKHAASVITSEERRRLREDSEMADTLEDIYSLMSYTGRILPLPTGGVPNLVVLHMLGEPLLAGRDWRLGTDGIQLIQRQRTAVLNEYPTGELLELYAVIRFFREILEGVCDGPDDLANAIDMSVGPGGIVRAWGCRSYESLQDDLGFAL
ncbi:hypothetical protein B0H13DRAFT_2550037 [Mycena leptocephala]|nr:hypothetical protein B0H13DRAFT_2550037 [Mycena leptocephala]